MTSSRRALLEKASALAGVGLVSAAGLMPSDAAACHAIPKSKGGCMKDGSSSGSGSGSGGAPTPTDPVEPSIPETPVSPGKASWSATISTKDYGADPYKYFHTSNKSWAVSKHLACDGPARVTLGAAPDGRPSVQMNVAKGINWDNNFLTSPFGERGVEKAVASVEIFVPKDFDWKTSNGKFALGLWGGTGEVSGGVPAKKQTGFSVRNVRANDGMLWGMRLYSYHLNRTSGNYGQVSSQSTPHVPRNRWFKLEIEVGLNSAGSSNGYALMRVDGRQYVEWRNMNFRRNNNIGIRGLFWQDMWGGTEEAKENWSPKAQKMWYSNYQIRQI